MKPLRIIAAFFAIAGVFIAAGGMEHLTAAFVWMRFHVRLEDYHHEYYDAYRHADPIVGLIFLLIGVVFWFLPVRSSK